MDYKKKSLNKSNQKKSYEEIDTRLASGWYVDAVGVNKKKKYKTKIVSYKISRKFDWIFNKTIYSKQFPLRILIIKKTEEFFWLLSV